MSLFPKERNTPMEKKPNHVAPGPVSEYGPPRILDRMLADIQSSVAEKMSAAGVSQSTADEKPPEKSTATPRKVVKVPTHPFEPAPDDVFSPPPEKPPKASFKSRTAPPSEPIDDSKTSSAPPEEIAAQPEVGVSSEQSMVPQPVPQRSSSRSVWLAFGTITLVLINITLVTVLLLFLFDVLPIRQEALDAPPQQPVTPEEAVPTVQEELVPEPPPLPVAGPEPVEADPAVPHLQITKVELARSVTGFALYEPIPDIPLRPHHVQHMFVYVEFRNPRPEDREDGRFVYNMTKNVRLFRADVGSTEPLMNTTVSLLERGLSPRQDFYARQRLQSARPIQPGEHVVEVRISDRNSGESITEQVTFMIHGN